MLICICLCCYVLTFSLFSTKYKCNSFQFYRTFRSLGSFHFLSFTHFSSSHILSPEISFLFSLCTFFPILFVLFIFLIAICNIYRYTSREYEVCAWIFNTGYKMSCFIRNTAHDKERERGRERENRKTKYENKNKNRRVLIPIEQIATVCINGQF